MNTVTKTIFSPEQLDELRARVLDYKEKTPASWYEIHQTTGIGESTIQAFALGTYKGNNQNVATEVEKWFKNAETMEFFSDMSVVPAYQPTATALNIRANLLYAKRGNIITIMGDPGVGKTEALDHFVWEFQNVWKVTGSPSRSTFNAIMLAILNAFNVPPGNRTSHQLSELVRRQFRNRTDALLIIDESQHLGEKALEELRAIHDDTKVGIAFCGNREVTRNIEGNRSAQFAQRYSRISMRQIIDGPEPDDITKLLAAWGVSNSLETKFLTNIALVPGGGALRSMTKCLELATIISQGQKAERNINHIKSAWDQLSAGAVA